MTIPLKKEQTLFLVQLCLATFRLDLVRKEQCTSVCTKIYYSNTPAERHNEERMGFGTSHAWKSTRILSVLLEVLNLTKTSSVLEASSNRVDSRIKQRYSLSWILDQTCVKLCTAVKKQILCTSLSHCGIRSNDCHSSQCRDPTFQLNVCIAPKSFYRARCL